MDHSLVRMSGILWIQSIRLFSFCNTSETLQSIQKTSHTNSLFSSLSKKLLRRDVESGPSVFGVSFNMSTTSVVSATSSHRLRTKPQWVLSLLNLLLPNRTSSTIDSTSIFSVSIASWQKSANLELKCPPTDEPVSSGSLIPVTSAVSLIIRQLRNALWTKTDMPIQRFGNMNQSMT